MVGRFPVPRRAADLYTPAIAVNQPYAHPATGLTFPAEHAGFRRAQITRYDVEEHEISVQYNDPRRLIALTVYVYPTRGRTLAERFEAIKRDVLSRHDGARHVDDGILDAGANSSRWSFVRAEFKFNGRLAGESRPLQSQAFVTRLDDHFLAIRATCAADVPFALKDVVHDFAEALRSTRSTPSKGAK